MKAKPDIVSTIIACLLLATASFPATAKPLKVFILAGQSNMQGMGAVSTFDHIGMDPKTAPMLADMRVVDGYPVVLDDVYITYLSGSGGLRNGKGTELQLSEKHGKLTAGFGADSSTTPRIGPEFTFGIYMHQRLKEPFLIIKTAWGGRSLNRDFCPPGSMPEALKPENLDKATDEKAINDIKETGKFYRLMMDHVKAVLADPKKYHPAYNEAEGYEIAGFVWFQGFNDMVDSKAYPNRNKEGGFDLYTELMAQMIRDIRNELKTPEMPVVIGVIGMDGPATPETEAKKSARYQGITPNFRKAQAAVAEIPEFKGTVAAVHTDQFWDAQLGDLDLRQAGINVKMKAAAKEGKLTRLEQNAIREKLIKEAFTDEELTIYALGRASQSYHYLGSAKIYGQIGKAFAEAMAELFE